MTSIRKVRNVYFITFLGNQKKKKKIRKINGMDYFYHFLHSLEKPKVKSEFASNTSTRVEFNLKDVDENGKEIKRIRKMLGVVTTAEAKERIERRKQFNFKSLKLILKKRRITLLEVAAMLNIRQTDVYYKINHGAFNENEIEILELKLGLSKGALLK